MLKGLNVLLTRENNDNIILAEKIVELGGRAFNCPLLSILPLEITESISIKPPDLIIFVSKNAVKYGYKNIGSNIKFAAIGITTKNLLEQYGATNIIFPLNGEYNTSGLLNTLQASMDLPNKSILIVKGVDGLLDLKNNLVEQGATVQELAVYKRIIPAEAANSVQNICTNNNINMILVTSEFILDAIIKLTYNKRWFYKSKICLVVPSERVASLSVKLGFRQVITATNVTHAEIMQTLISYHTGVCYAR